MSLTLNEPSGTHTNSGTITANGGFVVQSNESFTNTGTIDAPTANVTITNTGTGTFTTSNVFTMGASQTLSVSGGTLDYTAGSLVVGATLSTSAVTVNWTPNLTLGVDGPLSFPMNNTVFNAPSLTVPSGTQLSVSNSSTINAPLANEGTVVVDRTSLNGALTMSSGSVLRLPAIGANSTVTVASGFTNNGTIEYQAGGAGKTLAITTGTLTNAVGAAIDISGTGVLIAPFDNQGAVTIASGSLSISGLLSSPNTATGSFTGNGSALTVAGLDVDGATFDDMPLVSTNGTLVDFDNVTFQNMDPAATQFTINHPGNSSALGFDGLTFSTTPTTGLYISANDNAADGNTLTIDLTNSVPTDGSANTQTSGGAVVTWPDQLSTSGPVAFTSGSSGNNDIWLRSAGGTQLTQLTTDPNADWDPEWSPDGAQILFSSARDGVNDHVWVMNADGSGQQGLTSTAEQNVYASWSPDGSQIVFSAGSGTGRNVWTMNADGTNRTQLTNSGFEDSQANWSPDGSQIVFFSARDNAVNWQLYTMNSDGTNETRLTNTLGNDYFPQYSPDGTQIVFVSDRDGNAEIYVMNADGTGQARLTNNLATDIQPAWTPDGTQIVFSTDRDGNQELYIMDANGANQTRLTNIAGADQFPSVRPGG